jgi:xanthine dehydrogenase accessory factor
MNVESESPSGGALSADVPIAEALALQPLLGDWPSAALARLDRESCVVRVIVARVRGSAPREPGACMLVDSKGVAGTIGGGNLEREAIAAAREAIVDARELTTAAREPTTAARDVIAGPRELTTAAHELIAGAHELIAGAHGLIAGAHGPTASAHQSISGPERGGPIWIYKRTLARDLAQCCGGVVELWIERLTRDDRTWLAAAAASARAGCAVLTTRAVRGAPDRTCFNVDDSPRFERVDFDVEEGVPTLRERIDAPAVPLWLYGAGHVGSAVVRALTDLPFEVTWIDSRAALLKGRVPANTRIRHTEDSASLTRSAPASAYHLVMTHDHGIDFDVCHAILERGEFAWLGLIGSASKAAKFRARLARAGIPNDRVARLVCPIGVGGLTSKLPAAIAAGVTVQLLQELEHVAERALFQSSEPALFQRREVAPLPPSEPVRFEPREAAILPPRGPGASDHRAPHASVLQGVPEASVDRAPQASVHRASHEDCPAEDCKSCRARQGVLR